jgi:hypothetical protein
MLASVSGTMHGRGDTSVPTLFKTILNDENAAFPVKPDDAILKAKRQPYLVWPLVPPIADAQDVAGPVVAVAPKLHVCAGADLDPVAYQRFGMARIRELRGCWQNCYQDRQQDGGHESTDIRASEEFPLPHVASPSRADRWLRTGMLCSAAT